MSIDPNDIDPELLQRAGAVTEPLTPSPADVAEAKRLERALFPTADIRRQLTNQPPQHQGVHNALDALTDHFAQIGELILLVVPSSPERSTALTKLRECSMWAKAAVALNQDQITGG